MEPTQPREEVDEPQPTQFLPLRREPGCAAKSRLPAPVGPKSADLADQQCSAVVEGLLQFEVNHLEGVEERTASAILDRLRMYHATRCTPWADPKAERVMEFEVAVVKSAPVPRS